MSTPEDIRERVLAHICPSPDQHRDVAGHLLCERRVNALLPLIDTLLREQAEGSAVAIEPFATALEQMAANLRALTSGGAR